MAFFFFSYAREDDADGLIAAFHDELSKDVRSLGVAASDVAFLDQDMKVGEQWEPKIAEALRTSRVMVAMLSPTYFTRPYCGKEWSVFKQRVDQYMSGNAGGGLPRSSPSSGSNHRHSTNLRFRRNSNAIPS